MVVPVGRLMGVKGKKNPNYEARARRLGFTWEQMYQARPNAVVAHDLWLEGRDWHQWRCKP